MCNYDCFNCDLPDCICDADPTQEEMKALKAIDDAIDYEKKEMQAYTNGTISLFKYNHSAKGKARLDRYNDSEKGKARLQRYYASEKGKENERRKAERKRMQRLQRKGIANENKIL